VATSEELKIVVKAEVGKAIANLKGVQTQAGKTSTSAKGLGKSILKMGLAFGAAMISVQALKKVITGSFQAYAMQESAVAKLGAVIKATGGAAGFTIDQMKDMADEMQRTTIFGDELVLSAQAVLSTFRNISGETFPDTIKVASDMASVMGTDLQSAVVQLGKALNDPATGLTFLNRSGVTFSQTQKDLIKGLVESNDLLGAQGIILREVEAQFGGAAAAMADTATGALKQLGNEIGDLREISGRGMAELLEGLAIQLTNWIRENKGKIEAIIVNFPEIAKTSFTTALQILRETFKPSNLWEIFKILGVLIVKTLENAWKFLPKIAWERIKLLSTPFEWLGRFMIDVFKNAWGQFRNWGIDALQALGLGKRLEKATVEPIMKLDAAYDSMLDSMIDRGTDLAGTIIEAGKGQLKVLEGMVAQFGDTYIGDILREYKASLQELTKLPPAVVRQAISSDTPDKNLRDEERVIALGNAYDGLAETMAGYATRLHDVVDLEELANLQLVAMQEQAAMAVTVFNQFIPAFEGIGAAMVEGTKNLGSAIKSTIVGIIKMFANLATAQAGVLLASPIPSSRAQATRMFVAAAAAHTVAGAINAIEFAEGGIVTGPTNALIGEAGPEAVIPLSKMGGFGDTIIIMGDMLTQEEAYDRVTRYQQQRSRAY